MVLVHFFADDRKSVIITHSFVIFNNSKDVYTTAIIHDV